MAPFLRSGIELFDDLLAPLHWPRNPMVYTRLGWLGITSARRLAGRFQSEPARALFAGLAAHSMLPLDVAMTGVIGLVLGILAHLVGWPFAAGGSQQIAEALARRLKALGGRIETRSWVKGLHDLPSATCVFLNMTPRQILEVAGERFTVRYHRQLARYRYGPGVFKIDFALDGPIPWLAEGCRQAGTIHLGGTLEEIAEAEGAVWQGEHPAQPFVLLTQPTLFDPSRAPEGKHIAWAYCHVPSGSNIDMTAALEAQIERFAPGFRDRVLARHSMTAVEMESYNPNYIGGDINGGVQDWRQFFTRPTLRRVPYATSDEGIYLCSSATPPGGGVHGMGGYYATEAAKKRLDR
jgi:phytoene dehydrogenase-like protein